MLHIAGFWVSRNWDLDSPDHLGQPVRLHQSRGASDYQPHPAGDPGQHQHQEEQKQEEEEEEEEKSTGAICGGGGRETGQMEESAKWDGSSSHQRTQSGLAVWRPK